MDARSMYPLLRPLKKFANRTAAGIIAAAVVCFVGAVLLHSNERVGKATRSFSYNVLFSMYGIISEWTGKTSSAGSNEMILLYLDEATHREFNWPEDRPWNRATHAALLDRLTDDGARLVIFDIVFAGPGPDPEADEALAAAMKRNGRVVLAAEPPSHEYQIGSDARVRLTSVQPPYEKFVNAAAGWGIATLERDEDWIVREHWHGSTDSSLSSLAWAGAKVMNLDVVPEPGAHRREHWINYYDRPGAVPGRSYKDAFNAMPPGYFSNKVVIIGARSTLLNFGERRDEYRTPYTTWFKQPVFYPAVDVHAHMLLNLMRRDWLTRPAPVLEWLILLLVSAGAGFGFTQLRARSAFGAAAAAVVVLFAAVFAAFALGQVWMPWLVLLIQVVAGLVCSFFYNSIDWFLEERKLREQRQRDELRIREQAALLDKAQDAIFVYDLGSRITYWNESAERLYGWNSTEALNAEVEQILGAEDDKGFAEVRQIVLAKGEWNGQLRQSTKSGREIIVDSRCTRVCDDAGKPKAILVINTDVTERVKLETQLLRAQRMESIGTLAGGIAHDLNNVLSPVMMATQLLQMRVQDDSSRKFLSTIEVSAKRAADMVKQVLSFARGHEGEKVVLQLKHVIRDMENIMRETFPKSIDLSVFIAPNLPTIKGDATQLHQVILNLCVNARDAMPNGGKLDIKVELHHLSESDAAWMLKATPGHYVRVSVTDSGTGMPPEVIERIYEPFFTTKEPGKGTGLGLSTVLSIIRSHGGLIDVSSVVGKGTTFMFLLPAAEEVMPQPANMQPVATAPGNGLAVLVVDDEPLLRVMTETILSAHGYRVLLADNGAEAVTVFEQHRPQIVLLDMMMPVMDGPRAMRAIHKIDSRTRFIVMSGLVQNSELTPIPGMEPPVVLSKPFTGEKLLTTLESLPAKAPLQRRAA